MNYLFHRSSGSVFLLLCKKKLAKAVGVAFSVGDTHSCTFEGGVYWNIAVKRTY